MCAMKVKAGKWVLGLREKKDEKEEQEKEEILKMKNSGAQRV